MCYTKVDVEATMRATMTTEVVEVDEQGKITYITTIEDYEVLDVQGAATAEDLQQGLDPMIGTSQRGRFNAQGRPLEVDRGLDGRPMFLDFLPLRSPSPATPRAARPR